MPVEVVRESRELAVVTATGLVTLEGLLDAAKKASAEDPPPRTLWDLRNATLAVPGETGPVRALLDARERLPGAKDRRVAIVATAETDTSARARQYEILSRRTRVGILKSFNEMKTARAWLLGAG